MFIAMLDCKTREHLYKNRRPEESFNSSRDTKASLSCCCCYWHCD